jgi:hypothetical protein
MFDDIITVYDLILTPFYLILAFFIGRRTVGLHIEKEPYYKYYMWGLFAKILGGIGVCLIYFFYYGGGDTINYLHDGRLLAYQLLRKPATFFQSLQLTSVTSVEWYNLDHDSGSWPVLGLDPYSWFVAKCTWPFILLGFGCFIPTTILLNMVTFLPAWRLYKVFVEEFPKLHKEFAIAIFFVPSVAFWGSGLLKDNITFAAVCFYSHALYSIFVRRKKFLLHFTEVILSGGLLIAIKPYIFFALLPGSFLWLAGIILAGFKNPLIRSATGPVLVLVSALSGYLALSLMGDRLGEFKIDKVLAKAVITQQDLQREEYGGTSFNIGEFDPTPLSMMSKAHLAITAALFRPFLWETSNPVMMMSGLENFLLLFFSIYLLIKVRVIYVFRLILRHHLLLFSLIFSLFFAFGVGLSTSNFGSMVRYKIPAVPFFVASLIIARELLLRDKEKKIAAEKGPLPGLAPQ